MKQIEREALAVLKNFTKMSDAEWKMVEIQVAQRGITNVKGVVLQELQYCAEKARGAVAKHPGHANQSAHGNGGSKGGATGGGSPAGGGADVVQTTQMSVQSFDGLNTLHVDLAQMSVGVTGDTRAKGARHYNAAGRHIKAAELLTGKAAEVAGTDKKAANGLLVRAKVQMNMAAEQGFAMKTALGVTGSDSRYNAFDQKVGGIISQLNAAIRYSGVSKAVEPVEKHPGHPNQDSHGNGAGKAPAPAEVQAAQGRIFNSLSEYDQKQYKSGSSVSLAQEIQEELKYVQPGDKRMMIKLDMEAQFDVADAKIVVASVLGKSAEPVEKHPGHPNQASHGNGGSKGGSAGGTAPVSTATQTKLDRAERVASTTDLGGINSTDFVAEKKRMEGSDKKMAVAEAHSNDRLSASALDSSLSYSQLASNYRSQGETRRADSAEAISQNYRSVGAFHFQMAGAWASHAEDLGATKTDLLRKAVEPVEKHPGHANQSSHGNGGSKGGATGGSHQVTLMPQGGGNTKLTVETESVHPSKLVAGDIVMTPEKTLMSVNGGKTRAVTQGGGGNGGPGTDNTSHFLDGSPVIGLGNAGYLVSSGSVADRPRGSTKGDWDKMRSIDLGYGKSGSGSTDNLRVNRVTSVNGKDPKGSVL
jgi:hypothetical protein